MISLFTILAAPWMFAVVFWTCGALYFDVGRSTAKSWWWVAGWLGYVLGCLWLLRPFPLACAAIAIVATGVVIWWRGQRPRADRNWAPNFSQTCRIQIAADDIEVRNIRNTRYRSLTDYEVHYETRRYRLSELRAADTVILFWGSSWMSHPMVIFDFGNGQHLCFSVEVRYQCEQRYSVLASLYRQYELMYVVSDERDAILLRTKFGDNQECYLYRLQLDSEELNQLFLEYVEATNRLAACPRWYNAITDNCTTSVLKSRREKIDFDSRLFINGALDRLLHERGLLPNELPFHELKKRSLINEIANAAPPDDFSEVIRAGLPGFESAAEP